MLRRPSPVLAGQLAGIFAVFGWGAYLALARAGINQGLHATDFLMLRYGVAGLLMLPFLPAHLPALRQLGLWRAIALAAVAGPPFILFGVGGYYFAPLAHGAVIQPVTVTVVVTFIATAFMGEALTRQRLAGILIALTGIILVGLAAPGTAPAGVTSGTDHAWIGDILFAAAGLLYAAFTLLMRRWRVDPMLGVIVISVLSAAAVIPWFIAFDTLGRILAQPPAALFIQVLIQGLASGVLAVLAFGVTIRNLGAGPAALFPAMVPVAATIIGIPVAGEAPTPTQMAGLVLATAGLLVAVLRRG